MCVENPFLGAFALTLVSAAPLLHDRRNSPPHGRPLVDIPNIGVGDDYFERCSTVALRHRGTVRAFSFSNFPLSCECC